MYLSEFTAPENTTKVLSFNAALQLFGLITVPIVNGYLVDEFESYRLPFLMAGSLMVLGGISCICARLMLQFKTRDTKEENQLIQNVS